MEPQPTMPRLTASALEEGSTPPPPSHPASLSLGEEAVSIVTGYIMTFFIATIILGVTLISNQSMVSSYGDAVARNTLDTIGNNLALRIENVDRMMRASAGSGATVATLNVTVPIPLQVAGRPYLMELSTGAILMQSSGSAVTQVRVPLNNSTPIAARNLTSSYGKVVIYYNTSAGWLDFQ